MIVVISPAKTLDFDRPHPPCDATAPRFADDAATLARSLSRFSHKRLAELMRISPALAKLNVDRYRAFAAAPERPALYAFAGDVYLGLAAHTLDEEALAFAQSRLRMLSGLYGLLRPLDMIRPHRLEMGTRWAPRRERLTDWWRDRVAEALIDDRDACGSATVLNLASDEYWRAVAGHLPATTPVVSVDFRDGLDEKFVSFHAKKARGMMARWVVEYRVEDASALRDFDSAGYRYDAAASTPDRLRFTRP